MNYRERIRKVELLDLELGVRRELLNLSISERMDYLSRQSPLVLLVSAVIGGMAASVVSSRLGRKVVPRLVSLTVGAFRLWPSISHWIASSRPVQ